MAKKLKYATREEWLQAAADLLKPIFKGHGAPVPKVRTSIGYTSHGLRSNRIGECWSDTCSADKAHEIFIVPSIVDPVRILGILAHEMVHAAVGIPAGHGPKFRKVAKAIGLEGKMTATTEGPEFKKMAKGLLVALGPWPAAGLTAGNSTAPKKQTTRMIKCECGECGYTVRTTAKWLEVGAPICPTCETPMGGDGDD